MSDAHSTASSTPVQVPEAADPYTRRPDESHRQWFDRLWEMSEKRKQKVPDGEASQSAVRHL